MVTHTLLVSMWTSWKLTRLLPGDLLVILAPPDPNGDIFAQLTYLLSLFEDFLLALGAILFTISIALAGYMRATAFGSERRIVISNAALACSIAGLFMMVLASPIAAYLQSIAPLPSDAVKGNGYGGSADAVAGLRYDASVLAGFLVGLSIMAFTMAITVAGFMRFVAFGSERRIAASNAAVVCAVVGLLVILLADPLNAFIQQVFVLYNTAP